MNEESQPKLERRACVRFRIPGATVSYHRLAALPLLKNKLEEAFCPLFDLSRGGARFLTRQPVPLETHLELELQIPGETVPLKMKGKVRWVAPYEGKNYPFQVGVQFFPYGEEKGQNYPGNLVKIIALEQKFIDKTTLDDKDKDEFIV
jgi:Tfp pilus assembly protein PilZ